MPSREGAQRLRSCPGRRCAGPPRRAPRARGRTCSSARPRTPAAAARGAGAEAPGRLAPRTPDHQRSRGADASGVRPAPGARPGRRSHWRACSEHAHDGVVGADRDRAVVDEQQVGDRAEPAQRLVVVEHDRLAAEVAAGHHQRRGRVVQQQLVQRRAEGSITPRSRRPGATASATARPGGGGRSRSGARGRSPARLAGVSSTSSPSVARSGAISANGFSSRRLRRRSSRTTRLVVGAAGQVVAAHALDRHDHPGGERARRRRRRRPRLRPPSARAESSRRSLGPQAGQAFGCAWNRRLAGSSYSAAALAAHRERGHRRQRAVVRGAAMIVKRGPQSVQLMNG